MTKDGALSFFETLFGLQGRLSRAAYIGYGLLNCVVMGIVIGVLFAVGASALQPGKGGGAAGPALGALAAAVPLLLASLWVNIALGVKRLHDMDMSGAHMVWIVISSAVVGAIPFIGLLFSLGLLLWLWCTPGTDGANRFGQPRFAASGYGDSAGATYH